MLSNNIEDYVYDETNDSDKTLEIINVKINNINEIKEFLNFNLETIILNFNNIVVCDLNELPDNICNIQIENNLIEIEEINFNTKHEWNKIILKNSNIKNISEINNLVCNKLDLSDNELSLIKFNNCKINELFLSECNVNNIYFNNCEIMKIDLSQNRLEEIKNFPDSLVSLNLSNNLITSVDKLSDTIRKLDLSDNLLEEIMYLPNNLYYLELNNNRLTTLDINLLSSNIKYFDITNNCIKNNNELFGQLESEKLYYDTDSDDDDSDISIKFTNFNYDNNELHEKQLRIFDTLIPVEMKWKIRL
jgi:hypothetical protein